MRLRQFLSLPAMLAALVVCVPCSFALAADTPLIEAVRGGSAAAVRTLLDKGADPGARAPDGATALHWAAYLDDLATAGLLIDAGADVAAKNRAGVTPLSLACAGAGAALVARLIEAGADPNERLPGGETPLMLAARDRPGRGAGRAAGSGSGRERGRGPARHDGIDVGRGERAAGRRAAARRPWGGSLRPLQGDSDGAEAVSGPDRAGSHRGRPARRGAGGRAGPHRGSE